MADHSTDDTSSWMHYMLKKDRRSLSSKKLKSPTLTLERLTVTIHAIECVSKAFKFFPTPSSLFPPSLNDSNKGKSVVLSSSSSSENEYSEDEKDPL